MTRLLLLILALLTLTPASAHGTVSRNHHHRSLNDQGRYRNLFDDFFGRVRQHSRPLRTERPPKAYGADLSVLPSVSHERHSRQHLQSATILAKRPVKQSRGGVEGHTVSRIAARRDHTALGVVRPVDQHVAAAGVESGPRGPSNQPRQAQLPAGADYSWLRYQAIKQCWDDVDQFVRERKNGR